MNIQSHFSKYIGQPIFQIETKQVVILVGLMELSIIYVNSEHEEDQGAYLDFKIIISGPNEAVENNIPYKLCVIFENGKYVAVIGIIEPDIFLSKLRHLLYVPAGVTHSEVAKRSRKREMVELRNVFMAAYFCVYEHNNRYKISMQTAGAIFGLSHCTVIHAINNVNSLLDSYRWFREKYSAVWELVKQNNPKSRLHI